MPPRLSDLLHLWHLSFRRGQDLSPEELCAGHPELLEPMRQKIAEWKLRSASPHSALSDSTTEDELRGYLSPAKSPDELGWLDDLRILRILGEGGMGIVLRAEDTKLQRVVAVKIMRPHVAEDATHRRRFLREARAASELKFPHIIRIYRVGESNGIPYLVMPLLEGESLDTRLRRVKTLGIDELLTLTIQLASGLAVAHGRGIVHRDIKPQNLWLETDDRKRRERLIILDFGLARKVTANQGVTEAGEVLGTPAFMSPEQANGSELDLRSDLFSVGCVLYLALTETNAFVRDSHFATIIALASETPEPIEKLNPSVPPSLVKLVNRLLAKKPKDRPASAQEVVAECEKIAREIAPKPGKPARKSTPCYSPGKQRRFPRGFLILFVYMLVTLGTLLLVALIVGR